MTSTIRDSPSIDTPRLLSRVQPFHDFLGYADSDIRLIRAQAKEREGACEGSESFVEWCPSWPFNIACKLAVAVKRWGFGQAVRACKVYTHFKSP